MRVAGTVHRVEHLMGTAISVEVAHGPEQTNTLIDNVFVWLSDVDRLFSTQKNDSEVSRIDRGELALDHASNEVQHVFRACATLWNATGGYFDVQAGHHLDPSGFVKGWAVQVASDRLLAAGVHNHNINAGGDVRVRGVDADGQPWRVGIQHPYEKEKTAWTLASDDLAVATSGTYEHGFHILDPFTGQPARDLISVTVTGPDLGTADAYSTAALAMGARSLEWLASLSSTAGYESAAVMEDGRAFRSAGLVVVDMEL